MRANTKDITSIAFSLRLPLNDKARNRKLDVGKKYIVGKVT
jgi:hypothetical protein